MLLQTKLKPHNYTHYSKLEEKMTVQKQMRDILIVMATQNTMEIINWDAPML